MPRDLYPEWTTRPHAVHPNRSAVIDEPPVRPRLAARPSSRRGLLVVAVVFLGVLAAAFLVGRERYRLRHGPSDNTAPYAPDVQLEEAARARLQKEPDLRGNDVTVVVREQVATVSGRVASEDVR